MPNIRLLEHFKNYRRLVVGEPKDGNPCLVICAGTGGQASGSNDIMRIIKRQLLERKLHDRLTLRITGCLGFCEMDPFIIVEPGCQLYPKLKMADVPRIIDAALAGETIDELICREPGSERKFARQLDIPFFSSQKRTVLGFNQYLDPIRILDYVKVGGFAALEKVLDNPDPAWIIEEIKKSGLRGRGGAGFPTGLKWELARKSNRSNRKFIVCNADEGDPGAYMDRSLLEGNPQAILEGMTIAGIAIGATRGVIYVRSEYPLAIKHSLIAIRQARDLGVLGKDILGTGIDFDIDIVRGAGAFVCGEETALIKSVEGKMGEPRQRPPYPIEKGIFGNPTCINNVETLANVPVIIDKGAEEYASVGVPGNTGTKIFSLVGKVKNTGLVEVPLGTPISKLVYDIGGGSNSAAKVKAVQTGGPSGGCIPVDKFDLPIDYDSLARAGSIMGSGGMIVMDENTCMVDVAKYFMKFLMEESCGKCFTCRKGTQRMYEILEDISQGKGTLEHLDLLEELALVVKDTTMCGLGQSASNPVLSTLHYFRKEYVRHIKDKRCDAFVCKELVGAPCQSACPLGTEAWRYVAHIQRGEYEEAYQTIRKPNPFPSVCARVCNHPCEERCRAGTSGGDAVAIRALKRFITDRTDPALYQPEWLAEPGESGKQVAVIGSGPAGLTAAHYLSLRGHRVTVFEAEDRPGGMLFSAIPAYRLPREVIEKEIDSLLNEQITVKCNTALGLHVTIDGLFEDGYGAVFLAIGAHKSRRLGIPGEDTARVIPSIKFLKDFNLRGKTSARGHVGVIGGGNSAVDAARVALRQEDVHSVTIFYRRTRQEMPAFEEEIEAAIEEGIILHTLVSPVSIRTEKGEFRGVEFIKNALGEKDASGRRRPLPSPDTEHVVPLDTLIVAISEGSDIDSIAVASSMRLETTKWDTVKAESETMCTNMKGVFAGGDVVRGPNTVIDAIRDGKQAALVIDRYLQGKSLVLEAEARLPDVYVPPLARDEEDEAGLQRVDLPRIHRESRKKGYWEVELTLSEQDACREACRCLRCDLEFTKPATEQDEEATQEITA